MAGKSPNRRGSNLAAFRRIAASTVEPKELNKWHTSATLSLLSCAKLRLRLSWVRIARDQILLKFLTFVTLALALAVLLLNPARIFKLSILVQTQCFQHTSRQFEHRLTRNANEIEHHSEKQLRSCKIDNIHLFNFSRYVS